MVVILSKGDCGKMIVGVLKSISVHKGNVRFGCTVFEALLSKHCYYLTTKKIQNYQVASGILPYEIGCDNLADHQPLIRIGTIDEFIFALHHFVSKSEVSSLE